MHLELDFSVQIVYASAYDFYMKDVFRVTPIGFLIKPLKENEIKYNKVIMYNGIDLPVSRKYQKYLDVILKTYMEK